MRCGAGHWKLSVMAGVMSMFLGRDGGELKVDVGRGRDKRGRKCHTEEEPGGPVSILARLTVWILLHKTKGRGEEWGGKLAYGLGLELGNSFYSSFCMRG